MTIDNDSHAWNPPIQKPSLRHNIKDYSNIEPRCSTTPNLTWPSLIDSRVS